MSKNVVFLVILHGLILFQNNHLTESTTITILGSEEELKTWSQSLGYVKEYQCSSRTDCLNKIIIPNNDDNEVRLTLFKPEVLISSSQIHNLQYLGFLNTTSSDYIDYSIAVITNAPANGFEELRDAVYCHPGFDLQPRHLLHSFEDVLLYTDDCLDEKDRMDRLQQFFDVQRLRNFEDAWKCYEQYSSEGRVVAVVDFNTRAKPKGSFYYVNVDGKATKDVYYWSSVPKPVAVGTRDLHGYFDELFIHTGVFAEGINQFLDAHGLLPKKPPCRSFKLCVESEEKLQACKKLKSLAEALRFELSLDCLQESLPLNCLINLEEHQGEATLTTSIKPYFNYDVKELLFPINEDRSIKTIIVPNDGVESLQDIKGCCSCFQDPDIYPHIAYDIFSNSVDFNACPPQEQCQRNRFKGVMYAEYNKFLVISYQGTPYKEDFKVLCKNGSISHQGFKVSTDCLIAQAPEELVLVTNDMDYADDVKQFFYSLERAANEQIISFGWFSPLLNSESTGFSDQFPGRTAYALKEELVQHVIKVEDEIIPVVTKNTKNDNGGDTLSVVLGLVFFCNFVLLFLYN